MRTLLLAMAMVTAAGCASASAPAALQMPNEPPDNRFGIKLHETDAERPYVFAGLELCLDDEATARLLAVEPIEPEGPLRVEGFATRTWPTVDGPVSGGGQGTLREHGFEPPPYEVGGPCDHRVWEFALQVSRGASSARAHGFTITYEVAGTRREYELPFDLELCSVHDNSFSECET